MDNLRNFFLTLTTEMLGFLQHLREGPNLPLHPKLRALTRKRLRVQRITVVAHSGQSSQLILDPNDRNAQFFFEQLREAL